MNIKLDSKNRIRFSQEDLSVLKKNLILEQEFNLVKKIFFILTIVVDPFLESSVLILSDYVQSDKSVCSIKIQLSNIDLVKLTANERVNFGELSVEVDRWSSEKRTKVEKTI